CAIVACQQVEQCIGCLLSIQWDDRIGDGASVLHGLCLGCLLCRRIIVVCCEHHGTDPEDVSRPEVPQRQLQFAFREQRLCLCPLGTNRERENGKKHTHRHRAHDASLHHGITSCVC